MDVEYDDAKEQLEFLLRYSQRLCQRTARFYRRIQTFLTLISLLAGSSAVAALAAQRPLASAMTLTREMDAPEAFLSLTPMQKLLRALA